MYFSFLYFFKPLGLFLRLFGVFPCVDTNIKSAPFQVSKLSLSWALVVLISTGVSSFLQMPPLLISKVLSLLSLFLNMCIVPAVILNIKLILNFISKFQNFDENMKLCFRNKSGLNHGKYYTHIMICIYLLCSVVMVGISSSYNNSKHGLLTIFVHFLDGSLRTLYMNAFPLLIIFFLQEMKMRFQTYHNLFSSFLKEVSYNKIQLEWFLDNSRLLHFQLVSIVDSFNDCFGSCLLILFLVQFLQILLSLHVMLITITPFIFIYIVSNILGYIISTLSGDLILCSEEIKDILSELAIADFSIECKRQVEIFLIQARVTPVRITASGYFDINNNLVILVTTSVVAYLTVLINILPNTK